MKKKFNSIVYWYLGIIAVANIIGIISQLSQFLILQDGMCLYNIIVHGILVWLIYRVMFKADRQSVFIIFILGLLNAFIIGIMTNGDCFPQFFAAIVNIVLLSSLLCLKKDGVSGWKVLNKVVGKEKMKDEPLVTQKELAVNKSEVETQPQPIISNCDGNTKADVKRNKKIKISIQNYLYLFPLFLILIMTLCPFGYNEGWEAWYIYEGFSLKSMLLYGLLAVNVLMEIFKKSLESKKYVSIWVQSILLIVYVLLLANHSYTIYSLSEETWLFEWNYLYYGGVLTIVILNIYLLKQRMNKDAPEDDETSKEKENKVKVNHVAKLLFIIGSLIVVFLFYFKVNGIYSWEICPTYFDNWKQKYETFDNKGASSTSFSEINVNEVKRLYDALRDKGYAARDIGDEKTFVAKMRDKTNRKALYDYVSSRGNFRIGDYNDYERRLTNEDRYEYIVGKKTYAIPEHLMKEFEHDYPQACQSFVTGDGEVFDIPLYKRKAFLKAYPDAEPMKKDR